MSGSTTNQNINDELIIGQTLAAAAIGVGILEVVAVPVGALGHGVQGIIGKACYSFFNSSATSAVGGFATFAGVGAIAAPLVVIPVMIAHLLIDNSSFLQQHPGLQSVIKDTTILLLNLASVTAAAAILSLPIVPTVMCLMIVPAIAFVLTQLFRAISAAVDYSNELDLAPSSSAPAV